MLEKILAAIRAAFTAKGLDYDANKESIEAEVKKVVETGGSEIDLSKLDLSKFTNNDDGKLLEALVNNQKNLEAKFTEALTLIKADADSKKTDKEKAEAAAKAELEKNVKAAVDNVILNKKAFPEAQRETLTALATQNLDGFKKLYGEAQPAKEFTDNKKEGGDKTDAPVIRSTSGNALALKAIKEHQSAANAGATA